MSGVAGARFRRYSGVTAIVATGSAAPYGIGMRDLILCRERLDRILAILDRRGGELPVREFGRTFSVHRWEVTQAADLGWIVIEIRKPRTGRPSLIARRVIKNEPAKLPPARRSIPKLIRFRHYDFAEQSLLARRWGRAAYVTLTSFTEAYIRKFPRARSRRAAAVSAHRLRKHPHVRAVRAWLYAKVNHEIPLDAPCPWTAEGIYRELAKAGAKIRG
jgi:hypothetical protein